MVLTGVPLFLSEAIKCYYSPAFWVKITTLGPAVLFALTIRRRVASAAEGTEPRRSGTDRRGIALPLVHRRRRGPLDWVLLKSACHCPLMIDDWRLTIH